MALNDVAAPRPINCRQTLCSTELFVHHTKRNLSQLKNVEPEDLSVPSPTFRSNFCPRLQPFSSLSYQLKPGQNLGRHRAAIVLGGCLTLGILQISQAAAAPITPSCPYRPIMERLQRHTVQPGETLTQIASRYKLLSATLMGMNPTVRNGQAVPGQVLLIPPYNGILVALGPQQTLQSVARVYKVRPDILFEINGCQTAPKTVFVPGVNWSPLNTNTTAAIPLPSQSATLVPADLKGDAYPLPQLASLKRPYGWQANAAQDKIVFSSGVDLAAPNGTPVYAVANGIVAFAGPQAPWGSLVVINHARGRQTRYGYLSAVKVKLGQAVQRGQTLGLVSKQPAALRFELRYRSASGWVAQDPQPYLKAIAPKPMSRQSPSEIKPIP